MTLDTAIIGFGEAAQTFCTAAGWRGRVRAYDVKTEIPATRDAKRREYDQCGVVGCDSLKDAIADAPLILSLVTADQARAAAAACLPFASRGALFCDLNSVAPDAKRDNASRLAESGVRYADVAIMSPVIPAALDAPLLVSGEDASAAEEALRTIGFVNTRCIGQDVGRASAVKMIRSVMVKGIEALTAECILAADAAGVTDHVLSSLSDDWSSRADYNFDRMLVHGARRAAEMEEVAKTLKTLNVRPLMTAGTIERQRQLGSLGASPPPAGLSAKLATIKAAQSTGAV